jgi:D-glycero-D-manno-heptose 1,7-bisphosphate phosphatase
VGGAVFLDRDGTINHKAPERDYIRRPEAVRLLPGAAEAIRRLNDASVPAIVVTNQRGIALGLMTEEDLASVHSELERQLRAAAGARIDAFFHCPHDLGECDCRKPRTGLIRQAAESFPAVSVSRSVIVGDAASDADAGRRAGMRAMQLGVDVNDLLGAVNRILCESGPADCVPLASAPCKPSPGPFVHRQLHPS